MRFTRTDRFKQDFQSLPEDVKVRVERALVKLASNMRHPSLHTKRVQGHPRVWEMRVSDSSRITFEYSGDEIILRRVGTHDILRRP